MDVFFKYQIFFFCYVIAESITEIYVDRIRGFSREGFQKNNKREHQWSFIKAGVVALVFWYNTGFVFSSLLSFILIRRLFFEFIMRWEKWRKYNRPFTLIGGDEPHFWDKLLISVFGRNGGKKELVVYSVFLIFINVFHEKLDYIVGAFFSKL